MIKYEIFKRVPHELLERKDYSGYRPRMIPRFILEEPDDIRLTERFDSMKLAAAAIKEFGDRHTDYVVLPAIYLVD